ncbi:hypothetical protein JOB18_024984 [Solea senegalensis]|uniref:CCHC-type domain-containing protein n=1 Tax=Solea senegalensis TaxID=28829 RepID=A0AAV6RSX2_SOLSE|nr:hypothetical protein JOB18_024984 [Solea senegalensis]
MQLRTRQQKEREASTCNRGAETNSVADVVCFRCGLKGHLDRAFQCKLWCGHCKSATHRRKQRRNQDNARNSHITDLTKFKKFDEKFQTHSVELADGTKFKGVAERRGHAEVRLIDSRGKNLKTILRRALSILSYPQDILSVKAATSNGATMVFKKRNNVLIHRDGTKFNIHLHDRLYYLHTITDNNGEDQCKGCHDGRHGMRYSDTVIMMTFRVFNMSLMI